MVQVATTRCGSLALVSRRRGSLEVSGTLEASRRRGSPV